MSEFPVETDVGTGNDVRLRQSFQWVVVTLKLGFYFICQHETPHFHHNNMFTEASRGQHYI